MTDVGAYEFSCGFDVMDARRYLAALADVAAQQFLEHEKAGTFRAVLVIEKISEL